jgi:membrane protein
MPIIRTDASQTSDTPEANVEPISKQSRASFEVAKRIVFNIVMRVSRDNLMLVAAGVAFYAMTAIFPAIAAFVSIYGFFADPNSVTDQISSFSAILPPDSLSLLTNTLTSFAKKNTSSLSVAAGISVAAAIWSSKAGISALMTGLNIANETTEKRSFLVQQATGMLLTVGAIVFAAVALTIIAILPAVSKLFPSNLKFVFDLVRWPLLGFLICFALAILYRFGPYREKAKWRWITLGSASATIVWLFGCIGFTLYVAHFASYDKTYGSLAAPVVLLLWFWLTALVVLTGAEIDAEMEHADRLAARPLPQGAP